MQPQLSPVVAAVKRLAQRKNVQVAELARRTGMDKSHLSRILNGRQDPLCSQMAKIIEALDELQPLIAWLDSR